MNQRHRMARKRWSVALERVRNKRCSLEKLIRLIDEIEAAVVNLRLLIGEARP